MTRGEMMARMSAKEFDAWMAYSAQWPIGDERADIRAGIIAAIVANTHRNPKQTPTPYAPANFMLFRDDSEQTPEEMSRKFQAATGYQDETEVPEGVNRFGYEEDED
jgi:hypothetical protein